MKRLRQFLIALIVLTALLPSGVVSQTNFSALYALQNIQEFLVSGTWTMPSGWTTAWLDVHLQGGGGAGGGSTSNSNGGGGGGSGMYKRFNMVTTTNRTVTLGTTAAGHGGGDGDAGGNATFDIIVALGGNPGTSAGTSGGQIMDSPYTVTNKADWFSPFGAIGLAGGAGGAGAGNGSVGTTLLGFPIGGTGGGNGGIIASGGGGGGAASKWAVGGNGSNGTNPGPSSVGGAAGGYGAGGGGAGSGKSSGSPAGGAGGPAYCLVVAYKVN